MKACKQHDQNREVVLTLGNLVETLYDEVATLPLSPEARDVLVSIMLGDILTRQGNIISFVVPKDFLTI